VVGHGRVERAHRFDGAVVIREEAESSRPTSRQGVRAAVADVDGHLPLRSHLPRVEFRLEKRHETRYLLSVIFAVCLSWLVRVLPRTVRVFLAGKGGELWYRLSKTYRTNVTENLRQVLGADTSEAVLRQAVRNVFRVSGLNLVDLLLIPHLSSEEIVRQVPVVSGSWAHLDGALAKGRGAVLITGHLGCFDVVGQALHHRGYKLTSVTGRTTARFLFDAVTFLRRSHEMRLVEASPSGVRRVIQALRRGECAVFVTDRDFFQNGRPVHFFGRPTTLPPGAVRIARDTGAPIVPVFGIRTPGGLGLMVEPAFEVEKTDDIDRDVARGLERVVATLECAIGSAPEQWVMFQRVWPSAPADPVRVFPIGSPLEGELLARVDRALPRRPRGAPRAESPTGRTETPPQS
jgi:lauroyl/myristoyl acyltransferase